MPEAGAVTRFPAEGGRHGHVDACRGPPTARSRHAATRGRIRRSYPARVHRPPCERAPEAVSGRAGPDICSHARVALHARRAESPRCLDEPFWSRNGVLSLNGLAVGPNAPSVASMRHRSRSQVREIREEIRTRVETPEVDADLHPRPLGARPPIRRRPRPESPLDPRCSAGRHHRAPPHHPRPGPRPENRRLARRYPLGFKT